ncbi:MAG: type II toxin-antitoxin system PemK/MazF family toxin [Micrococcaceae bacterium]
MKQGDIFYFNLDPTKGVETQKTRPCIVVSNAQYNKLFNTVIIVPISSSPKYVKSLVNVKINCDGIQGTALLQHIKAIDPKRRVSGKLQTTLPLDKVNEIAKNIQMFFPTNTF